MTTIPTFLVRLADEHPLSAVPIQARTPEYVAERFAQALWGDGSDGVFATGESTVEVVVLSEAGEVTAWRVSVENAATMFPSFVARAIDSKVVR